MHGKQMSAQNTGIRIPVVAGLIFVMLISIALEWRGLNWMNDYGPKVQHSFNVDDNRFVEAAGDFRRPEMNRMGYPEGMTAQLFLVAKAAEKLFGLQPYYSTTLRSISLVWAQFALLMTFLLGRRLGLSLPGAVLAAFFLAVSPQFVLLANQGTPDVAALGLFYATILAAIEANRRNSPWWFYTTSALAGVCLAVKFLLPAIVPVALLILRAGPPLRIDKALFERTFLAICIGLSAFCAANFFNFTPWDFWRLLKMLMFDNVLVVDGESPPQQILLYTRALLATTGLATSAVALVFLGGWAVQRAPAWRHTVSEMPRLQPVTAVKGIWAWLGQPSALLILPVLAHLFLIITAQTHSSRHILVCVPLVCVAAAAAIEWAWIAAGRHGFPAKGAVALTLAALASWTVFDAAQTARQYWHDIRMDVVHYLRKNPTQTTTHNFHSHVRYTSLVPGIPDSPRYVTCDRDYERYLRSTDAAQVWHPVGGQQRVDFYHALFSGRTPYRPVLVLERQRLSLEDRLAGDGWIGELDGFYATKCFVFERTARSESVRPG
jgi:hypothetical protein